MIGAGVVDRDYTGQLGVVLFNMGRQPLTVLRGGRITQLICERYVPVLPLQLLIGGDSDDGGDGDLDSDNDYGGGGEGSSSNDGGGNDHDGGGPPAVMAIMV